MPRSGLIDGNNKGRRPPGALQSHSTVAAGPLFSAVPLSGYCVTYISDRVGKPRTLSLYIPPTLEPRSIAVPAYPTVTAG